ncbi:nitrate reductase molybdenum cofactor assembly chaperone [Pigmentiphaga aceris]|uniref:Nitrate reductase molybdenum cofactor assembly chaperone n=1 Tax=Pigmentiphaga aceris TaxID=1940612 RepID=A0A5C0AT71_9BURK|nr:nitrate reductase molybdenum cofactor assembly chaperone [Pigmentiphaga aceris]QEI04826.1 nitrate reductase molybdenum cofactor assembly chaperone [Pigmentiphaga aceris]
MSAIPPLRLYSLLSALLDYPGQELLDAMPELDARLHDHPIARVTLMPLTELLASTPLIALQENYVATFDRNPAHSLHLFEHIHGESRDRGQAMVDLLAEYQRHGLEPQGYQLPDHVPLFLEFLGTLSADEAENLLDDAIHVLAAIGSRLARNDSPYASVFKVLCSLTSVEPREQADPPVRDMDEAMETFGVGPDGAEPLLRTMPSGPQPLRFHPRAATAH